MELGLYTDSLPDHTFEEAYAILSGEVEHAFHPGGGPSSSFRLNFSSSTPEQIETGMRRLGEVVAEALEQSSFLIDRIVERA